MAAHGSTSEYYNGGCRCDLCRAAVAAYQRKVRAKKVLERAVDAAQGVVAARPLDVEVPAARVRRGRVVEFVRWLRTRDGIHPILIEARMEKSGPDGWLVFLPADTWAHVEA